MGIEFVARQAVGEVGKLPFFAADGAAIDAGRALGYSNGRQARGAAGRPGELPMFGARRIAPDSIPMDQNVVLLFFEYLTNSPDERGVWRVMGKEAESLEGWLRAGWTVIGQSQSSQNNMAGMQVVLFTYTLGRPAGLGHPPQAAAPQREAAPQHAAVPPTLRRESAS